MRFHIISIPSLIILFFIQSVQPLRSETIDESAIFSDEETVVQSEAVIDSKTGQSVEKESISFTGFLNSRTSYTMSRDYVEGKPGGFDQNQFLSYFQSNYSLDVRLRKNIKGFANASVNYYPNGTLVAHQEIDGTTGEETTSYESEKAVFGLEELFADINFNKIVYFRIGKQFLKWGTGILWTPSDLINVDKKDMFDPSQVREGVYGGKLSIPFGTFANFYTFVNMSGAENVDELSSATKLEVLIGNTEISVSVLARKGSVPVYGFDFTSRLFTIDMHGEASTSYGDPEYRLDYSDPYAPGMYKREDKWITSLSFGLGRSFEFLDIKDRIRFDAEFFYNGRGYEDNITEEGYIVSAYFIRNNLFIPNYYGMYYAGLSIFYNRLFIQDLNLSLFYIRNISDESSVIFGNFAYNFEYNVSLNLAVNGYLGEPNREYTIGMDDPSAGIITRALSTEFMVKLVF